MAFSWSGASAARKHSHGNQRFFYSQPTIECSLIAQPVEKRSQQKAISSNRERETR